jgi:hypothetical protein
MYNQGVSAVLAGGRDGNGRLQFETTRFPSSSDRVFDLPIAGSVLDWTTLRVAGRYTETAAVSGFGCSYRVRSGGR